MSVFCSVDSVGDATAVVAYLDHTARAASGMKHYAMAAHPLRKPDGPVLDLGCGAGHDLALLAGAGMRAVGVDPSAALLSAARDRLAGAASLVRSVGGALPFADGSLAGCRIERVLMHAADPAVERAITAGRIGRDEARAWLDEQRDRDARGVYFSTITKAMIVGRRPERRPG